MEWGQQMRKHQQNTLDATYSNTNYNFERIDKKTLIIDSDALAQTAKTFSLTLYEPFIIDKLSDIYLDSFTTFNAEINTDTTNMGIILDIDQFNIKSNSTNKHLFNKIYIPNEDSAGTSTVVHKGKKLNYICSINPVQLSEITGSITDCPLDSSTPGFILGASTGRFIAEFVIVNHD